jgi:hypothetical protein
MSAIEHGHVNTDWMKNEPIGRAVEGLRKWGNRPNKDSQGRIFYRTLYFRPDPWNKPNEAFLVCDGSSVRHHESKPWRNSVGIQLGDGSTRVLEDSELAGYMDKAHWHFWNESHEDRQAAAKAVGFSISTQGYQPARVTEG